MLKPDYLPKGGHEEYYLPFVAKMTIKVELAKLNLLHSNSHTLAVTSKVQMTSHVGKKKPVCLARLSQATFIKSPGKYLEW